MTGTSGGKTAIIVGAGQTPGETIGNGRAMAVLFAREGAPVMCVDRITLRLRNYQALPALYQPQLIPRSRAALFATSLPPLHMPASWMPGVRQRQQPSATAKCRPLCICPDTGHLPPLASPFRFAFIRRPPIPHPRPPLLPPSSAPALKHIHHPPKSPDFPVSS